VLKRGCVRGGLSWLGGLGGVGVEVSREVNVVVVLCLWVCGRVVFVGWRVVFPVWGLFGCGVLGLRGIASGRLVW